MLSLFCSLSLAFVITADGNTQSEGQTAVGKPEQNYTLAYKKSVEEDKPLMVVVGATWCPACQVLKQTTIATMEATGQLDEVSVAVVDKDAEPELAKELMAEEKMMPQIIFYSKDESGHWNRSKLTGFQPEQPVRSMIRRVVQIARG